MKRLALATVLPLLALPATALSHGGHRHHRHHPKHAHARHAAVGRTAALRGVGGFSITPGRYSVSVVQGSTTTLKIKTAVTSGSQQRLTLHESGLPSGASASFTPQSLTAGAASIVTITAGSAAPGRSTISFVATGITVVRSVSLPLTVTQAPATTTTTTTTPVPPPPAPPATTTTSPTPPPSMPSHVETWSYDDGCNGGVDTPQSVVRQWLTYAESNCGAGDTHALDDCHAGGTTYCTAIQYLDANMIYKTGSVPIASDAQESWWVHEPGYSDAAHRLAFDTSWGTGYLLDQDNPAVQSWFQNYVHTSYDSFDGLMMDDTGASQSEQFYGSGQTTSQELTSDSSILSEHEAMASAVTHSDGSSFMKIDNGLSVNPWLAPSFPLLNNGGVTGLIAEGDPISDGTIVNFYSTLLDDMSYVDHTPSDFLVLLSYDPNGSLRARRIQAATVLLGYKPGHIVSWSDLEQNNSNLSVWPEEGIYPTDPVQTMAAPGGSGCMSGNGQVCSSGGHNDLQVAPGVYRREFKTCYEQGVAFGNCAVIVNDTGATITVQSSWLTQNYQHEITMNGGDVQSGGTINPTGSTFSAGSTTIPADDAAMLGS